METKILKAVIYARFSSFGQREESIEGQLRECRAYAARKGYEIVGEYIDRALSATTDKRPDFQKMIKDSEKHTFDIVLCWKHDRFARNRYDAAMYKARLKQNGVRIDYAAETVPEGADGIILDAVMEGYAEYYSANLSQNVKRGLYESARKRQTLGVRLLGYREGPDKRFEIDPETGPVVQQIFDLYVAKVPAKRICEMLNEQGIRTAKGAKFTKNSINIIIRNEKYKGVYRYADIYDENGVPPLVSKEMWDAAQEERIRHHEAPAAQPGEEGAYLLTGKLFCGHCKEGMISSAGTSGTGKVYQYYNCKGRKKNGCHKKPVDKEYIEDIVVRELAAVVHSDEIIELFADRYMLWQSKMEENITIEAYKKKVADIDKQISNVVDAIASYGGTALVTKLNTLEEQRSQVQAALDKARLEVLQLDREDVVRFLMSFRDGDIDSQSYRAFLVRVFLQAAFLYDDGTLIMQLNYSGTNSAVEVHLLDDIARNSSKYEAFALPQQANLNCVVYAFRGVIAAGICVR